MYSLEIRRDTELDRMGLAETARLCYTCGICVGDCPAARFSDDFNPRQIVLKVCLGIPEGLEGETSPIWKCTTCYTCHERCPAGVKPLDIILALRNRNFAKGACPRSVKEVRENVLRRGVVSAVTQHIVGLRQEMGLPPMKPDRDIDLEPLIGED